MWMVAPRLLCRQHLLGEHLEVHMLANALAAGKPLTGYVAHGLVELDKLNMRHDALAEEMTARGYKHKTPLAPIRKVPPNAGHVDVSKSIRDLRARCAECRKRIAGDKNK
jgi:hypothetical protein